MATVTTSNGSRSRSARKRPIGQAADLSNLATSSPALLLHYSHRVLVSFQIQPQRLLPLLPKGIEPELIRSKYYVTLAATHYRRSSIWGMPLVPAFSSLVLSTNVRATEDASLKGKFVFRRRVSGNFAAWHLKRKLDLEPHVGDVKCQIPAPGDSPLPSVNFQWHAGEAMNYLKVKAKSSINDALAHDRTRWAMDHRSEFTIYRGPGEKTSQEVLRMHCAAPDKNCHAYDVAQAGFKCRTDKVFGVEFVNALARRPARVILLTEGTKSVAPGTKVQRSR